MNRLRFPFNIIGSELGVILGAIGYKCGFNDSVESSKDDNFLRIMRNKQDFPVEYCNNVKINDKAALSDLLDKTWQSKDKNLDLEWGTFLKLHHEKPDKNSPSNFMNLIFFNSLKGPELLANNRFFVYIPANKDKDLLVRARFKDVWDYLGNIKLPNPSKV
jgi:hypothetical protein